MFIINNRLQCSKPLDYCHFKITKSDLTSSLQTILLLVSIAHIVHVLIERIGRDDFFSFSIFDVSVIDALVIPEAVKAAVDPLANVADWFSGWSHMNVLDVALQSGQ